MTTVTKPQNVAPQIPYYHVCGGKYRFENQAITQVCFNALYYPLLQHLAVVFSGNECIGVHAQVK